MWYSQQVENNMRDNIVRVVDTKLSIMKLLGAKWLEMLSNILCQNKTQAINGFKAAGICDMLNNPL